MNAFSIAPVLPENLPEITRIHLEAFPERALTSLGERCVFRYYQTLLENPRYSLAIGAFRQGKIIGYLFGGETGGLLPLFLKKNAGYLAFYLLTHPWLLAKPIIRRRVSLAALVLNRWRHKPQLSRMRRLYKTYSVLVIAVDPAAQQRGAGRCLMDSAEQDASDRGYTRMHLSVDLDNTCAIQFYEHLGWVRDGETNWNGSMNKILVPAAEAWMTPAQPALS